MWSRCHRETAGLGSGLLFWHGAYDSTIVNNAGGTFTFSSLTEYVAGLPATFAQRQGAGVCCFGVSQLGVWTEDDISVSKTVNLAIGLRKELESDTSQAVRLAPRGQLDWSPSRVPHTTFRIGAGIFYTWLNPADIEQTVRVDGVHQQDLLIINPGFPDPTVGQMHSPPRPVSTRVDSDVAAPHPLIDRRRSDAWTALPPCRLHPSDRKPAVPGPEPECS
jgi:hypothetical protein